MAAETIYEQLKAGLARLLRVPRARSSTSDIGKDLYESRNMEQPFEKGLIVGGALDQRHGRHQGQVPGRPLDDAPRRGRDDPVDRPRQALPEARRQVHVRQALERLHHRQRDPGRRAEPHPDREEGAREVAEMWQWMCPAGVYEIPEDAPAEGPVDLIVNYTNCVQCGAITAKGGRLTPPEGGDGPLYTAT